MPQVTTARFAAYGVTLGIEAPDARALARLAARLPPGTTRIDGDRVPRELTYRLERQDGALLLRVNGRALVTGDARAIGERLESHAALRVAASSRDFLFIHAAVVGWRGRALVLPGRSMAGKSTLTAALVRAGASYASDEYALVDGDGRVHPYPRAIVLRGRHGPRRSRPTRVVTRPMATGAIVLCRYRAGAQLSLERLPPGRAVLALLKHTVAARAQAATAMERWSALAMTVPAFVGVRGEADAAAAELLALL